MPFQNVNRELVRTGFVRSFRIAFSSCMDFRYKTDPNDPNQPADDSGVFIYDSFPWTNIKYPSIVVSLGPGDPLVRTIGGDFQTDSSTAFVSFDGLTHNNVDSETYGGGNRTTVLVSVFARSSIERSRIMDWIDIFIRHLFVDAFTNEGVAIESMSQGGEKQVLVGNDPVFLDTLSVNVYSEFGRTISTEVQGTIDGISILNVFSISADGSTT